MRPIVLHGHTRAMTRVKYNRDGDLLFTCAKDSSPTVWNAYTGERLGTYEGHTGAIWDIDVNFTSTLVATAGADQCAKIWDLLTGECVATIMHETPVRVIQFSHGDSMLLTVTDASYGRRPGIHIFNLPGDGTPDGFRNSRTSYNPWLSYQVEEKITSAVWGPTNDTVYFAGDDGAIVVLDLNKREEIASNPMAHKSEIRRIVFDKDYCTLMSASLDQTGKLWDAKTLELLKTYETDKPCNDCDISPLKNQVIIGGGQDAQSVTNASHRQNRFETRFFHKIYMEELTTISGHFGPLNTIAFSPDGRGFATGGEDGFVRLHRFDDDYFTAPDV
eukprot:TRINITY_DN8817_c0_g1_i1.p1 TRINITY_DN8817_c0_g1~~TRINITY_DN8817_c0_g1_i1.p1  ORF type:complete len:350 (-),score=108.44 TRINITY_DN8817_c0_g1_i1:104-1099(-)